MKDSKFYNDLEAYLYNNYSKLTAKSYVHHIKKFIRQKPNADLLKFSDIGTYFLELKQQGTTINYRGVILSAIKVYYSYLIFKNMIEVHPCNSYYMGEKKPTRMNFNSLLSLEEMESLFKLKENRYMNLLNRDNAIIGLLIYQGVTSNELVNIKIGDVEDGTVFIKIDCQEPLN
jgi:site-specific recombinase XerD